MRTRERERAKKKVRDREFLIPRGVGISQTAYRPLNQRRIIRTQSILENNALNRVIVVHITHTPLTTYTHTIHSFVVFTIASSSRP